MREIPWPAGQGISTFSALDDLTLLPSEEEFRDEVRSWLQENHPGT